MKTMDKRYGVFLIVEDMKEPMEQHRYKRVFYKAFHTREEAIHAVNKEQQYFELVHKLNVVDVELIEIE